MQGIPLGTSDIAFQTHFWFKNMEVRITISKIHGIQRGRTIQDDQIKTKIVVFGLPYAYQSV